MIDFYIKKSLEEHRPIDIIYMSKNGITQRTIRVFKVEGDKIAAYCYLRKSRRVFNVRNILAACYTEKDKVRH